MGLIKEVRHLKKVREFEAMVQEVFGKSVKEINEILDKKLDFDSAVAPREVDEKVVQKNEEKAKGKMTAEELVAVFAEDVEEFYPDGNAPHN